jgi:hypothetical protein
MRKNLATSVRLLTSLVIGAGVAAFPLVGSLRFVGIIGAPAFLASTLLGTNDKWGLPPLQLYLIVGTVVWGLVVFLIFTAISRRQVPPN